MAKYLLNCECGKNVPVEVGQAGGQVQCPQCGRSLDVPTLRKLRHLPTAEPAAEAARSAWGPRQGVITVGVLLAVVLLALAGWSRWTEPEIPEFNPAARLQSVDTAIDKLTPVEGWHLWVEVYKPLAERGLAVLEDPRKPALEQYIARKRFFQTTLLIAAAISLAVAIAATLWPTPRKTQVTSG